jgi:hypothetical protein
VRLRNGLILAKDKVELWPVVNIAKCQVPWEARECVGLCHGSIEFSVM